MKKYLGVKLIEAEPMTRLNYNILRGWTLPADENGADEGYKVVYNNDGKPHVSWSPKEVFEKVYFEIGDNKINNETFNNFIAEEVVKTEEVFGKPTTVMHVRLVNGMVISDSTTCVDPKNYSEEIGAEILRKRIADKIWFGLGFALQCGLKGVK